MEQVYYKYLWIITERPEHFNDFIPDVQEEIVKYSANVDISKMAKIYQYSKINDKIFIFDFKRKYMYDNISLYEKTDTLVKYINKIGLQHIGYHINDLKQAYVFLSKFRSYMGNWDFLIYIEEIKQYMYDDNENNQKFMPMILDKLKGCIDEKTYNSLDFIWTLIKEN